MKYDPANPCGLTMQGLEAAHTAIEDCLAKLKQEHGEGVVLEALAGVLAMGAVIDPARAHKHLTEHLGLADELEEAGLESGADDWDDNNRDQRYRPNG